MKKAILEDLILAGNSLKLKLFGLSFWRHPFTEEPLVMKRCNITFLQICSDEETKSSTFWMAWGLSTFSANVYFGVNYSFKFSWLKLVLRPNATPFRKVSMCKAYPEAFLLVIIHNKAVNKHGPAGFVLCIKSLHVTTKESVLSWRIAIVTTRVVFCA